MDELVEIRARMVVNGYNVGNEITVRLPSIPDPRIEQLKVEKLRVEHQYEAVYYKYQMLLLKFRPWWKKLLRMR
jgi:hypothetical protein